MKNRSGTAFYSLINWKQNGAPAATRTRDPLLRRQMLYPTELRAHKSSKSELSAQNETMFDISTVIFNTFHPGITLPDSATTAS
jgi:hypothetical protein